MIQFATVLNPIQYFICIDFQNQCIKSPSLDSFNNPTSWSNVSFKEVYFIKWGGGMLRTNGFVREELRQHMREELYRFSLENPQLSLKVPEVLRERSLFDLYKEYELEIFRNYNRSNVRQLQRHSRASKRSYDKVCFLIKTSSSHDVKEGNLDLINRDVFSGYDNLVHCKFE